MTRQRVQLKRIECAEKRRECYRKRKEGLKKKIYQLSTLCGVEAFLVCFGPSGDVVTWPPDDRALRELVEKYEGLTAETKAKHSLNMSSYLLSEIEKQQKRLSKVTAADDHDLVIPPWNGRQLGDMTEAELRELLQLLDATLERARRRIACLYLESGRAEAAPPFTCPTRSAEDDVSFASYLYGGKCFDESLESGSAETTTPLAGEGDNNVTLYHSVEGGDAETVPWLTYPATLLTDEDDNFATTTTTYLSPTEIPLLGYFPVVEKPSAEANFDRNNVFFPSEYNINTSPLASTSDASFQEENNMSTFSAPTTTVPPISTSALYYYG